MTAPRSFQMAAKATTEKRDKEYPPRDYRLVSESGDEHVVTAHYPGDGILTLLMASTVADDVSEQELLAGLFGLLEETFSEDDYKYLRARLRSEEITIELLMQIVEDMIEGWAAFPTQQPSASTRSRPQTGTRSTGRVRGATPTPSISPPVAS